MSKVDDGIREAQVRILEGMKKRRDALNTGIANLEYVIDNPTPPLNIDFEVVKEEARRDMEFLDQCEKVRKGGWVSS